MPTGPLTFAVTDALKHLVYSAKIVVGGVGPAGVGGGGQLVVRLTYVTLYKVVPE